MKYDTSVIYQIYPLTFNDANKDGIGDINGIKEKLDYIKSLGVSFIWLCPPTQSPLKDNGYDVSDYYKINPIFGTNEDYDSLIKSANEKGIDVMMDLVMNHTSDKHEWFEKSIKRIKPFDEYYVWRKEPVPGFDSQFENTCWTYVEERGEYYLHQFSKHQPDVNWENPEILKEFRKIIEHWVAKGICGFRFDVVDMIGKQIDKGIKIDVDRSFELLRQLGEGIFTNNKLLTVGECWSTGRTQGAKYTSGENPVLSMVFNARYMFMHENGSRWNRKPLTIDSLVKYRDYMFAQNTILKHTHIPNFIENHDFARSVSRFWTDEDNIFEKSKLLLTIHFLKRGTSFIFQGQELGLPNAKYSSIHEINDVETQKVLTSETPENIFFGTRDNPRKPIPWNGDEFNKVIPTYKYGDRFIVKNEIVNLDSPLNFWKQLVLWKQQFSKLFANGKYELVMEEIAGTFSYTISNDAQELIVATSWFDSIKFDPNGFTKLFSQNFEDGLLNKYGIYIGIKNK